MTKKILILSPINQYGGVNMDVAFLSQILDKKNDVKIISLANYFEDSSVYHFDKRLNYTSLNKIIYDLNFKIRFLTKLVSFLKPLSIPNHFRTNNLLTKHKPIQLENIKLKYLAKEIGKADVIFICSQLTAKYNADIVNLAFLKKKTILLKVTGHINDTSINNVTIEWLKKVDLFIFHSYSNQKKIEDYVERNKCEIIDQHSYLEDQLLSLPFKTEKLTKFFTLSRLHSIKQIGKVVDVFNKISDPDLILNIYGDGENEEELKKRSRNKNIKFHGKIAYNLIPDLFKNNDCLVISSSVEAGPYTGIESMAAGTPLISTVVGAMEERLGKDYPYFYNGSEKDLVKKITAIAALNEKEVGNLSQSLKEIYLKKYNRQIIEDKYTTTFNKIIRSYKSL